MRWMAVAMVTVSHAPTSACPPLQQGEVVGAVVAASAASGAAASAASGAAASAALSAACGNSFDHLVGAREQRWRNIEAERLRGLEVDHQLEFGRLVCVTIRSNLSSRYAQAVTVAI